MGLSITIILIIMTGLISYQSFENAEMRSKLILHPFTIKREGDWYRLLTSGFIHADWGHLLINMYVLYTFGEYIEIRFGNIFGESLGRIVYVLFYLSAIIISSIPTYFKHQDHSYYRALGASGATSAIVLIFVVFHPWEWFIFPPIPAIVFAVAYLWYSSYMSNHGKDNIGHDAHFWGAAYGAFFILSIGFLYDGNILNEFMQQLLSPKGPRF